ncbi:hypothetical protein EDD36DRAFT_441176 [Exophiala viscosa]|uniref:Secreted protein n=1 Tax=Exophiala viscosa TaxID=2486360 RepID=A0AAN6DSC3_9EURO|nr:hypothetical protein EDD36DRAFT_441176 [Exophiala viscosa]
MPQGLHLAKLLLVLSARSAMCRYQCTAHFSSHYWLLSTSCDNSCPLKVLTPYAHHTIGWVGICGCRLSCA